MAECLSRICSINTLYTRRVESPQLPFKSMLAWMLKHNLEILKAFKRHCEQASKHVIILK